MQRRISKPNNPGRDPLSNIFWSCRALTVIKEIERKPRSSDTLLPLLDVAGREAALDTGSDVGRDLALILVNISAVDGVSAERARNDVAAEVEVGLSNLLDTGVLASEASDEGRVGAEGVELGVHGTLGEDGHLVLGEVVDDGVETVLQGEFGNESALHHDVDLRRARVDVGSVEAAGAEETKSHGDTGTRQGGESLAIGLDSVATSTDGVGCVGLGFAEVIDLVSGSEEVEAVDSGGSLLKRNDERLVVDVGVSGQRSVWPGELAFGKGRSGGNSQEGSKDGRVLHVGEELKFWFLTYWIVKRLKL